MQYATAVSFSVAVSSGTSLNRIAFGPLVRLRAPCEEPVPLLLKTLE